jgi:antitoxin (DNA-binding transcriptional repressor) of toxin-antitoxin stability system
MKRPIGIREMKSHGSRILRRLRETGEDVPIAYRGAVVAHLVPAEEYERLKAGRAGFWKALLAFRATGGGGSEDGGDAFADVRDDSLGRRFRW